jgi:thiol-disulfide isomerase/thioredoxin
MDYINQYILMGQSEASLVQIYDAPEGAPYYTFQLNLAGATYDSVVTADGSKLFTNGGEDLNAEKDEVGEGNFMIRKDAEVITEDGKPVIYLFTSASCPHCTWEKPVMQEVVDQFGDAVIYKQVEDSTEGQDVYYEYGTGGVPLVVLGGKYYREGAGEMLGEDTEKEVLTNYICELTGNIPESICQ